MRKSKILEKLFQECKKPELADFLGPNGEMANWKVTMVTGPVPNMGRWPLNHGKTFIGSTNNHVEGYNFLLGPNYWGFFNLSSTDEGSVLIDYDDPMNGRIASRIRDYVRKTSDSNFMIGKFYFRIGKTWRFLAYFTLTRIPNMQV